MTKSHDCDGEITPRDLKSLLDNAGSSDQLPIVLDVRTLDERERFGAIPGSWHIALDELEQTISINVQTKNVDESRSEFGLHPVMRTLLTLLFEKSKENPRGYQSTSASDHGPILVIYCKTGPRSRRALEMICDFFQQKFPLKNPIDSQIPWLQKINILKGGFLSWMEQQHTFEPSNG